MEPKKFKHIDVYKLIFETSTEGIVVCDREGVIRLANEAMLHLFGYSQKELQNQKIELLLPDAIKELHKSHREGYNQSPERKQMGVGRDLFGKTKSGRQIPIEISLNHMTIDQDFFVMALITDISERKKQETKIHDLNAELEVKVHLRTKELIENQVLYSLIAENFPNGIIGVLNQKLEFTFAEGEELKKSGIKGKFLIGKSYLDSFNKEYREEVEAKLNRVFEGSVTSFEIGKRKSVYHVDAVPLVYPNVEEISQILVVEHNVTRVKNIENKMQQSLEREKELNEMKSQFVSMASHEFRTPLSTILSSVSLIEKYDALGNEEKKKVHFEKVKKNINNLTNMLNDTLTISRIEENMTELKFVEFHFLELIQEVITETDGLKVDGQEIKVNFAGEEVVICDPKIIKIILANLLSNALKYSEKEVKIDAAATNGILSISVIDFGIGIPLEDQSKLFERFYRAKNAANIQGTGLGLNIVNSYLTLLDGTIEVLSEENVGTTFSIKIPIR